MAVMTAEVFKQKLLNIEQRPTLYCNSPFPQNLCFFDGTYLKTDCWNLIKSLCWNPEIDQNYTVGAYANNIGGNGMADTTILGIFNANATYRSTDFNELISKNVVGACIRMNDEHAGVYIGDGYVVESTPIWEDGVQKTIIDGMGNRISLPEYGSQYGGKWTEWAMIEQIDYSAQPQPQPEPTPATGNVTYAVLDDIGRSWLPFVNNDSDYAGVYGSDVDLVAIKADGANIQYIAHTWAGDETEQHTAQWLGVISQCNTADLENGCAGIVGSPIDALAIASDKPIKYRVHYRKANFWEEWVTSKSTLDLNDAENGYAGTIGMPIDAIQMLFA